MFERNELSILKYRINQEPWRFIQLVLGPRQIGK
jgi:hypothetical protein